MRQLTVLHAVPDLRGAAGGIAAALPSLCEALREEGIESRVITQATDSGCMLADRTKVLDERSPWALARRMQAEVYQLREDARRDGRSLVCHSHGIWSYLNHSLASAARSEQAGLVISLHGMLLPYARNHKCFRKAIAWRIYQARDLAGAQTVHVTSDDEAAVAKSVALSGQVANIPFGVDVPLAGTNVQLSRSSEVQNETAREQTLLFLGRVHPIKNLDGLIKAFSLAQIKGWRLRIVGPDEGGHREVLRRLAKERGVAECVTFEEATFGEAKARLLAEVDLLVLPSHSENFGVVVAEALAFGTPAIASTGTPWSALQTHQCGWWVPPEPSKLAAAIRASSALSREALREMGGRGRTYVENHLTWTACGRRMADLYRNLAEQVEQPHIGSTQ